MKKKQSSDVSDLRNGNNEPKPRKKKRKKYKPRKKLGRKRKKRLFEETRVGHFLKYEAPLEYNLIMEVNGSMAAPSADLIEAIGYASLNLLFRKPKFRKALIEYRKNGLYIIQPRKSKPETELYYIGVRRSNAQKMMKQKA